MHDTQAGPLVVCSILEREVEALLAAVREAPAGCGLVEIRADHIPSATLGDLVRRCDRPVVVTIRRGAEGGGFEGSEGERRAGLLGALAAGARFVDVEWNSPLADLARGPLASRVILSDHGAPCREQELRARYERLAETAAARLKIVAAADSVEQAVAIRDLLRHARGEGRLACFALGRAGALTRLLAPSWGSWASYGAARRGGETASGQFTAREMLELYDVLGTGPRTRWFGLIGQSVFCSPSPAMHRAGYVEAGIDARYIPIELDSLEPFVRLLEAGAVPGLVGFAVTLPFKAEAAARCAVRDALSEAAGAVNTVLLRPEGWHGFNTDGPAALDEVRDRLALEGARVALLGAGGTARALATALRQAGARVTLYNRTRERAERVACEIDVASGEWKRAGADPWDLLVNATPLGGRGERVIADDRLTGRLVLDAVYAPGGTPLAHSARERGLGLIDGLQLLVAQAVLQFERMTGIRPDPATLSRAGRAWLSERDG